MSNRRSRERGGLDVHLNCSAVYRRQRGGRRNRCGRHGLRRIGIGISRMGWIGVRIRISWLPAHGRRIWGHSRWGVWIGVGISRWGCRPCRILAAGGQWVGIRIRVGCLSGLRRGVGIAGRHLGPAGRGRHPGLRPVWRVGHPLGIAGNRRDGTGCNGRLTTRNVLMICHEILCCLGEMWELPESTRRSVQERAPTVHLERWRPDGSRISSPISHK